MYCKQGLTIRFFIFSNENKHYLNINAFIKLYFQSIKAQFCSIYDVITKLKMAENGTIFKTRTYDFFRPFNEPKELPMSKCAYIEVHTHMLPAPGVYSLFPAVSM